MRSNNENPPSRWNSILETVCFANNTGFSVVDTAGVSGAQCQCRQGAGSTFVLSGLRTGRENTMQITVAGKQVDLSDALRTRVSGQMDTIAGKYFDHALEAHVTFGRARSFFTCDINVHAGRGLQLRGEGEAADANAAFDDAAEHIAKRLRRYRRRVNDHQRDMATRERPEAARQYILQEEM